MKPLLLKHLSGEPIGRFPVWMMRQAGRYLPSYQEIRKNHSFWEMVTRPELAAKVSLTPLEYLNVDAIIFFSDILTLPYGLGIDVTMQESVGPVVTKPLRDESAFFQFGNFDPSRHTPFVGEALQNISKEKSPEKTLIGFAGAPWTVGSYLIEGKSSRHYAEILGWMHRDPESLSRSLHSLMLATVKYLKYQISQGAQMVQLFDTWLSEMPQSFFKKHYRPILDELFSELKKERVSTIYFAKNTAHLMRDCRGLPFDGWSADPNLPLKEVEQTLGENYFLQGNLDPVLLLTQTEAIVRRETRKLVAQARELARPAILNLGHGILPATPVANAKAFIEEAQALWI